MIENYENTEDDEQLADEQAVNEFGDCMWGAIAFLLGIATIGCLILFT